jgi:hypothetical protein
MIVRSVVRQIIPEPSVYATWASVHMAAVTMADLTVRMNDLPVWRAGSPDFNPSENIWAIRKRHVEELSPETKEELIDVIITVWTGIEMFLVNKLIDSIPE